MTTLLSNFRAAQQLHQPPARRPAFAVVFGYFLVAGVATVMLGPTLPLLAERWSLPDAQLGTLFFAYFAGQLSGAWFATRRLGVSLLLGSAASAIGFCALAFAGSTAAHALLFMIGVGIGAGLTAGNVIVGTIDDFCGETPDQEASRSSRSRLLALLNLSWGIGAITCPLWLRVSVRLSHFAGVLRLSNSAEQSTAVFFTGLAIAFAGIAALVAWLLPPRFYLQAESAKAHPRLAWKSPWVFVATMALYVGVENALAGWLPTYAQRLATGGVLSGRAAEIALCFWVAELAGRALTAIVIKRLDEHIFYRTCLLILITTIVALVVSPRLDEGWLFGLTVLVALSLSPIFPLAVSFLLARIGSDPKIGKIFASASLGGSLLPWLTGIGSAWFQSLRVGFVVPATGAIFILVLSLYLPSTGTAPEEASHQGF